MKNINFGREYMYSIQYHIVWYVKYRRKVLIDDIEKTLKELLIKISRDLHSAFLIKNVKKI